MSSSRTLGKEYNEILAVDLPEGNLPNPSVSGELQASRLPRLPWLKIPRQIFTLQNILKHRTNHHFLSPIANGVPLAIILLLNNSSCRHRFYCLIVPQESAHHTTSLYYTNKLLHNRSKEIRDLTSVAKRFYLT